MIILLVEVLIPVPNHQAPDRPPQRPVIMGLVKISHHRDARRRRILRQLFKIRPDNCDILEPGFLGVLGLGDVAKIAEEIESGRCG